MRWASITAKELLGLGHLQASKEGHEIHHCVNVFLVPSDVPQGAQHAQPAEGLDFGDVGSQEKQDDVEVIQGAGQHLPAQEIKRWQHLVDGEEPLVPLAQLEQVVDDDRSQENIHATNADAGQLEDGEEDQLARNSGWDVGLVLEQPGLDQAAELILEKDPNVEVAQVETSGGDEDKEEEVSQHIDADEVV